MKVPFFRPEIGEAEITEVAETLRSGWLTTGPRTARFERDFARAVGARHAVAVSSGTAALHLAVHALGLEPGQAVLVPTMTFAATAEAVRYCGAVPLLVDCDPETLLFDFEDAGRKLELLREGKLPETIDPGLEPVGMIPVHVGGLMVDLARMEAFAGRHGLWTVEDAAHAFPAAWRQGPDGPWRRCGEATSSVTCFSFYANKTITTGEGGMAVTPSEELAEAMRRSSLHGLSRDAWGRYTSEGSWDYRILDVGFKYNLTDVAAAIGLHQLERAEAMRERREAVAHAYLRLLAGVDEVELPAVPEDRIHAWHLFPLRLRSERLEVDRNGFLEELRRRGIGFSVHWRPLHLHPDYERTFGWRPEDLPRATEVWQRSLSLPIFPGMRDEEVEAVAGAVRAICRGARKARAAAPS